MTVRETSLEVYRRITEEGLLSKRRMEVYQALYKFGPCSANELFRQMKGSSTVSQANIQPRLGELIDLGVVREIQIRECRVTGNRVIEYDVTPDLPITAQKKKPSRMKRVDPDLLARDIKDAIFIGPITEINARLEKVFRIHFGVSYRSIILPLKKPAPQPGQLEFEI